ncbi:DUF4118 domain-containing protein [Caulobacter sp. KR2-114]|uniref:DUF4118 domain-containing protein n=1 Tax=Caulobacter sp. KR2-114 TaxID=3400912 RepID=UPI003BFC5844
MPRSTDVEDTLFPQATAQTPTLPRRRRAGWASYLQTTVAVGAIVLLGELVQPMLHAPSTALPFVLPVILAAVSFGWRTSMYAAVLGALAYDFFFTAPVFSLRMDSGADIWSLGLLLLVGAIVSTLAAQSRQRALDAERAAARAQALQDLADGLMHTRELGAVTAGAADALARIFQAPAVVLIQGTDRLRVAAKAGGAHLSGADMEAAAFAADSGLATRAGVYPADKAAYDFWPVRPDGGADAVLGVKLADGDRGRPKDAGRFIRIVGAYVDMALGGRP